MGYITLNKEHYFYNLQQLCDKLGAKERLAVVLKDNAYGHGLLKMASLAAEFGIERAVVRTTKEAIEIAHLFPFVLVLSASLEEADCRFSYVINSLSCLKKLPKGLKIHLKVDSGMHRNGIAIDEMEEAFIMIAKSEVLLEGVMTHFRSADELSTELFWQMKVWEKIKAKSRSLVEKYHFNIPLFHAANSASVMRLEHYHDSFARCGIATYGYNTFSHEQLKPVLSLWAEKISMHHLKKGARIGYGGVGVMERDGYISTYDIGYGDGYLRSDGKKPLRTAEGYDIVGRVSMDNISVKSQEDKVLLFHDASSLASYHDTIVYEILTRLSPTLKRVIL